MSDFFKATFLLIGTIIGAGVFALPYAFFVSGLLPAILGLLFLGLVTTGLNLLYSKVIIATKGDRQLPGYVRKYLGTKWSFLSLLVSLFSLSGALISYVVLSREFLSLALGRLPSFLDSFWFLFICLLLFSQGFKALTKIESFLVSLLMATIIVVPIGSARFFSVQNFSTLGSNAWFFWGPVLFALTGFSVIPEVEEIVRKERSLLPKVIITGGFVSILLYLIFGLGVWGVSGPLTTVDALSGLSFFVPWLVRFGSLVGLLSLITSFLSLANVAKETYHRDLKVSPIWSRALAVAPAFLGVFLPMGSFITVISLVGTIGLAISGTMICLIAVKLEPRYRVWAILISFIFIFGAVNQLL